MGYITLLGTGTCELELERRASSVLIELDDTPILFDCGHGTLQRLLELGLHPNNLQHVILSHFHPDHVSDLIPLLHSGAWSRRYPRTTDLHIYGPLGVRNIIDGIMNVFNPEAFQQPSYSLIVHEVTNEQFQIGKHCFDFVSLPPAGNHGIRFASKEKLYAITGDSHFHEEEITFLKHADLAIIDSGHLEDTEIVQLAVASQAKRIVCSHLYRSIHASDLQTLAVSAGYQGTIITGRDYLSFVL